MNNSPKCEICGKYKPNPEIGFAVVCDECRSTDWEALRAENKRLRKTLEDIRESLKDILRLIEEHGSTTMKAHATRIRAANISVYNAGGSLKEIDESQPKFSRLLGSVPGYSDLSLIS